MRRGTLQSLSLAVFVSFYILALPASVLAAIEITEIMYDAPGSDSGREWIEIANTGSSALDVAGYKLFEAGINHGVSVVVGTSSLSSGESAIIANNTDKFLADWPSYAGALYKSSFSLSNTGETISIKDRTLSVIDSVTYSSAAGAGGDENSLHKNGDSLIASAPNPGSTTVTAAIVRAKPIPAATTKSTSKKVPAKAKTSSPVSSVVADYDGSLPVAAALPKLPSGTSTLWSAVLGLVALVIVGVAGALFARSARPKVETSPSAEEFKIE